MHLPLSSLKNFWSTSGLHIVISADILEEECIQGWFVTCRCLQVFCITATFLYFVFANDILAGTDFLRR